MINTDTHSGPSFSLTNRILRVIWGVIYILLFKYTPIPFFGWRTFILKIFQAKIGFKTHIYPKAIIWAPWNVEIGDESGIANGVNLYSQGKIIIGKKVIISQGSYLCAGTHDYTKEGFPLITKTIEIGNNVWIAAEAFIHPGVIIEENVVVGARSVVVKNLPKNMVCAGHPCVPIKKRY